MAERHERFTWQDEDTYWRNNFRNRPYASGSSDYDVYRPGYRYGFEAAERYQGRDWNEIEADLSRSWDKYEHRGNSTWEQIKAAARDAWDRVTGNRTTVGSR